MFPNLPIRDGFALNLIDGDQVLRCLLFDLSQARRSINVAMYLFFNDMIGREIADILIAKASDSVHPVKVRVMLDVAKTKSGDPFSSGEKKLMEHVPDFTGNPLDIDGLVAKLRKGNVEVLDTNIDYDRIVTTNVAEFDTNAANIRKNIGVDAFHVDHRKLITIDSFTGYCGSANIGAQYLYHHPFDPPKDAKAEALTAFKKNPEESWHKWKWHDGLVQFAGRIVFDFEQTFRERWVLNGGQDFESSPVDVTSGGYYNVRYLQLVTAQPDGNPNPIRELFKTMIAQARSSIFIENPYLYHPQIVEALIAAKKQYPGLRVDLVLPSPTLNDSSLSAKAQRYYYERYIPAGINVFEYQNHFTHLKIATFDDRHTIVGSANLNYRSLDDDKDFEMVVHIRDFDQHDLGQGLNTPTQFTAGVNASVRDVDIAHSKQIRQSDLPPRSYRSPFFNNPEKLFAELTRHL